MESKYNSSTAAPFSKNTIHLIESLLGLHILMQKKKNAESFIKQYHKINNNELQAKQPLDRFLFGNASILSLA